MIPPGDQGFHRSSGPSFDEGLLTDAMAQDHTSKPGAMPGFTLKQTQSLEIMIKNSLASTFSQVFSSLISHESSTRPQSSLANLQHHCQANVYRSDERSSNRSECDSETTKAESLGDLTAAALVTGTEVAFPETVQVPAVEEPVVTESTLKALNTEPVKVSAVEGPVVTETHSEMPVSAEEKQKVEAVWSGISEQFAKPDALEVFHASIKAREKDPAEARTTDDKIATNASKGISASSEVAVINAKDHSKPAEQLASEVDQDPTAPPELPVADDFNVGNANEVVAATQVAQPGSPIVQNSSQVAEATQVKQVDLPITPATEDPIPTTSTQDGAKSIFGPYNATSDDTEEVKAINIQRAEDLDPHSLFLPYAPPVAPMAQMIAPTAQMIAPTNERAAVVPNSKKRKDDKSEGILPHAAKKPRSAADTPASATQAEFVEQTKEQHDTSAPFYLDDCKKLPANGLRGRAHLIDVEKYMNERNAIELKMSDIVATVLYNYSPRVLDAFLSINQRLEFTFTRKEKEGSEDLDFCIQRNNSSVSCGYLNNKAALSDAAASSQVEPPKPPKCKPKKNASVWDGYGRVTNELQTGRWNTQFSYEMKPRGKWDPKLWVGPSGKTENRKKEIEKLAVVFGNVVFEQRKWAPDEGVSFEIDNV